MLKYIVGLLIVVPAVVYAGYYMMNAKTMPFETVCDERNVKYDESLCQNVGKRAESIESVNSLNKKDYGPIIGVAWRSRGSVISSPGRDKRYASSDAYYYIIGSDKTDNAYLRLASEIEAK